MCQSITISLKRSCTILLVVSLLGLLMTNLSQAAEPIRIGAVFSVSATSGFAGPLVGAPMRGVVRAVVQDMNRKGGISRAEDRALR